MILNEVMKDTADAIREKTGTTEKIAPVNFAEEIKSISAGGGESGGWNWRYFDYSAVAAETKSVLMQLSHLIAMPMGGQMCIVPSSTGSSSAMRKGAICWDVPIVTPFNEAEEVRQTTYGEMVGFMTTAQGIDFASIPEITEAEFYDLNA